MQNIFDSVYLQLISKLYRATIADVSDRQLHNQCVRNMEWPGMLLLLLLVYDRRARGTSWQTDKVLRAYQQNFITTLTHIYSPSAATLTVFEVATTLAGSVAETCQSSAKTNFGWPRHECRGQQRWWRWGKMSRRLNLEIAKYVCKIY